MDCKVCGMPMKEGFDSFICSCGNIQGKRLQVGNREYCYVKNSYLNIFRWNEWAENCEGCACLRECLAYRRGEQIHTT
jgi:hypothetical protein